MPERAYLDWNASAPLRAAAREAVCSALALSGNPSSVHREGRAARRLIEDARGQVAVLVGAEARNVVFTSGGTEANALALTPLVHTAADKAPRDRLLVSAVEHPSVLAGGRFEPGRIDRVPVDANGVIDLAALDAMLGKGGRTLVSVMAANNETGVVQPLRAAAEIAHRHGALLHVDAVQAAGRVALDIHALGADMLTLSAHKLGGPKGAGALVKRDEQVHIADPLIRGGGQERGSRAGTENVAAIAGFGAAAMAARENLGADRAHMLTLRERVEAGLRASSAVIFGVAAERLPNTTLAAMPGAKAETLVIAFDLDGVAVSSGAACSSGKVAPSHVLAAMSVEPALARGAIRVSLGADTTAAEVDRFLQVWNKAAGTLSNGVKRGLAA